YCAILLFDNKREFGKKRRFHNLSHNILLAVLANISAYALNQQLPVFQESTHWLSFFLITSNLALLWISYKKFENPDWLNFLLVLIIGMNLVFQVYETIYIAPIMMFGVLVVWFFGLSLHAFVPLWLCILFFKLSLKAVNQEAELVRPLIIGVSIPVTMFVFFLIRWVGINHQIHEQWQDAKMPKAEVELPAWVTITQRLSNDWITDRILKSQWVYALPNEHFMDFGGLNMENKRHDPFVMTAALFGGKLDLKTQDKVLIYNTLTNERHFTERRLWRGNDLVTEEIVTNVQLMPEYRLAYTEKNIQIKNTSQERWRGRQQEAIYTFHLTEGSVVTSASLWINGKEAPSILTTKGKAEEAYERIVGVESRDPLLVTWQEGNRVSARIFPCTPDENREFKIGITTPLKVEEGNLIYQNIDFKGPNFRHTDERINIIISGDSAPKIESNLRLKNRNGGYIYDGNYRSDWHLEMKAPLLSSKPFVFKNRAFQLQPLQEQLQNISIDEVYLDINQSWTKADFEVVWEAIKDKAVFVYTDCLIQLNEDNKAHLFKQLAKLNFSIFPFHKIKNPQQALVISAYGSLTPTLSELANQKMRFRSLQVDTTQSTFAEELNDFLQINEADVPVFHLGQEVTTYLKTLEEVRAIRLHRGELSDLEKVLSQQQFPSIRETENLLALPVSEVTIQELEAGNLTSQAPDHLMRLYVYNDLMRKIGRDYFDRDYLQDSLLQMASEATVLSPISSFVTLETQEDYDRFDIKNNEDGLQNANFDSDGAVPEPHEWMMIILVLGMIVFMWYRKQKYAV
ncbi:MAG: XrtN system VIT domain-containing protein, partial [Bacteroidota bacterium]